MYHKSLDLPILSHQVVLHHLRPACHHMEVDTGVGKVVGRHPDNHRELEVGIRQEWVVETHREVDIRLELLQGTLLDIPLLGMHPDIRTGVVQLLDTDYNRSCVEPIREVLPQVLRGNGSDCG